MVADRPEGFPHFPRASNLRTASYDRVVSDVRGVLQQTREQLRKVELALEDIRSGDPGRKMPGWSNVPVWGRAVTTTLQKLRSAAPPGEFDEWYEPWRAEMEGDPLLRWIYMERNRVLKEGVDSSISASGKISDFDVDRDVPWATRPPGAKSFFVGDPLGGSGWLIELPDGTTEKYYVALRDSAQVTMRTDLAAAPDEHLGKKLPDRGMVGIATAYVAYLRKMYASAMKRFWGPNPPPLDSARASPIQSPYRRTTPKIGPNDPCHCGTGLKFKKCHGRNA